MLLTLEQGLGSDFTPQVKMAWVTLYKELTGIMGESLRIAIERKRAAALRATLASRQKALPWWCRWFSLGR